jgi:hypothetical protein
MFYWCKPVPHSAHKTRVQLVCRNLLQSDKLLEKLRENYTPPSIIERIRLKIPGDMGKVRDVLRKESQELNIPLVAAGTSSVGQ